MYEQLFSDRKARKESLKRIYTDPELTRERKIKRLRNRIKFLNAQLKAAEQSRSLAYTHNTVEPATQDEERLVDRLAQAHDYVERLKHNN